MVRPVATNGARPGRRRRLGSGWHVIGQYSAYRSQSGEGCTGPRYLAVDQVTWSNGWPHVNNGKLTG